MLSASHLAAVASEFAAADLTDLRDLVTRLPREQQIAVVLRHWQQASEVEIAAALGVTTRTVRNYLRRAHMRLRAWYEGTETLA
jgi:DNA-directed RNA polymerase specialized sigma24 family protein